MSDSDSDGPGRREVAHRLFAAEFEDADLSYSESDEERAPNYVVTPSGARVNRLLAVGVLTEVEQVSEDVLRGRVVDPTGAFVLYAGQYQPDEQAFLERAEPPMFVAVTGKARTFQPDDADTVYTSVRPETISEVDADTRDRWTVDAAERTLDRVGTFAAAARMDERGDALAAALGELGIDDSLAEGVPLALDHYGTPGTYLAALRELALDAARVVAGRREEVEPLTADPGAGDDGPLAGLAADLGGGAAPAEPAGAAETEPTASAGTAEPAETTGSGESAQPATSATASETGTSAGGAAETAETAGATATVESTAGSDAGAATGTEAVEDAGGTDDAGVTGGASGADEVGDFEGGGLESDEDDDLDDFEPEEFELDEEEREEIEEEYGTDFQSGTEVEEPGEADIETPEVESDTPEVESDTPEVESGATEHGGEQATGAASDPEPETEPTGAEEPEPGTEPEPESESEPEAGTEQTGDPLGGEELEDAVVDLMGDLDEGDGVAREDLVGVATERYGADAGAVEEAIQEALMGGRCYEPDDGTLKPI